MITSNTNHLNRQCSVHKRDKTILCMNPGCKSTRLCCELCRVKDHQHHVFKTLKDLDKIAARLGDKDDEVTKNISIQSSLKRASDTMNKVNANFNHIDRYLQNLAGIVPSKLMPPFKYLNLLAAGQLTNHSQTIVGPEHEQQFQHIASLYRFLSTTSIQRLDELGQIVDTVGEKISGAANKLKTSIENAFSEFYYEIQKCEIKNWQQVYREKTTSRILKQKSSNESKQKHPSKRQNVVSLLDDNESEQKPVQRKNRFVDNEELNQMIQKMFEQVFQIRPILNLNQKQPVPVVPTVPTVVPAVSQQNEKLTVVEQPMKKFSRFVYSANANKKIAKNEIIKLISKLTVDRNYLNNLREFILEGPNEFDIDCLKKLAACFPNLTKFNYIWNFEEAGLRLQKEQAFFELARSLEKDMRNFELTQELLDTYGQFQHLQNLSINQVEVFAFKELKIKNRNILHLTIGEYVQSNQQEILPNCLKNEALLFNGLITLNIFNVKKIDGGFMQSMIDKNLDTLRNLWLSECIELEESFYNAIQRSKLESIMFDQIKKINRTISVPKTIKTLIIDNCQLYHRKPFSNLARATNLKNFSIFDSIFYETKQIGDQILQQLSQIPNCNIEYLSVAECGSVTNQSLNYLEKMNNLKELCIDNTNICLYQLTKHSKILNKITKLGIVGVQIRKETEEELKAKNFPAQYSILRYTLEKILKKSPSLRLISLKFEDQMAKVDIDLFRHVEHLSISALPNQKFKKKLLSQFIHALKENSKKLNIVQ